MVEHKTLTEAKKEANKYVGGVAFRVYWTEGGGDYTEIRIFD